MIVKKKNCLELGCFELTKIELDDRCHYSFTQHAQIVLVFVPNGFMTIITHTAVSTRFI